MGIGSIPQKPARLSPMAVHMAIAILAAVAICASLGQITVCVAAESEPFGIDPGMKLAATPLTIATIIAIAVLRTRSISDSVQNGKRQTP